MEMSVSVVAVVCAGLRPPGSPAQQQSLDSSKGESGGSPWGMDPLPRPPSPPPPQASGGSGSQPAAFVREGRTPPAALPELDPKPCPGETWHLNSGLYLPLARQLRPREPRAPGGSRRAEKRRRSRARGERLSPSIRPGDSSRVRLSPATGGDGAGGGGVRPGRTAEPGGGAALPAGGGGPAGDPARERGRGGAAKAEGPEGPAASETSLPGSHRPDSDTTRGGTEPRGAPGLGRGSRQTLPQQQGPSSAASGPRGTPEAHLQCVEQDGPRPVPAEEDELRDISRSQRPAHRPGPHHNSPQPVKGTSPFPFTPAANAGVALDSILPGTPASFKAPPEHQLFAKFVLIRLPRVASGPIATKCLAPSAWFLTGTVWGHVSCKGQEKQQPTQRRKREPPMGCCLCSRIPGASAEAEGKSRPEREKLQKRQKIKYGRRNGSRTSPEASSVARNGELREESVPPGDRDLGPTLLLRAGSSSGTEKGAEGSVRATAALRSLGVLLLSWPETAATATREEESSVPARGQRRGERSAFVGTEDAVGEILTRTRIGLRGAERHRAGSFPPTQSPGSETEVSRSQRRDRGQQEPAGRTEVSGARRRDRGQRGPAAGQRSAGPGGGTEVSGARRRDRGQRGPAAGQRSAGPGGGTEVSGARRRDRGQQEPAAGQRSAGPGGGTEVSGGRPRSGRSHQALRRPAPPSARGCSGISLSHEKQGGWRLRGFGRPGLLGLSISHLPLFVLTMGARTGELPATAEGTSRGASRSGEERGDRVRLMQMPSPPPAPKPCSTRAFRKERGFWRAQVGERISRELGAPLPRPPLLPASPHPASRVRLDAALASCFPGEGWGEQGAQREGGEPVRLGSGWLSAAQFRPLGWAAAPARCPPSPPHTPQTSARPPPPATGRARTRAGLRDPTASQGAREGSAKTEGCGGKRGRGAAATSGEVGGLRVREANPSLRALPGAALP
ncbi:collagen alpha-1(I) chain-like [Antechinus flavipes]|uniref:collagen alpha-1(I) chain-like n=1 Tax=Antechinus flavipes TaxID=38775 RepID=UPI002236349D|nr:collagen alpha-1(I) chain-like [Antechinus flavipes]